jgi:hypothetical protein
LDLAESREMLHAIPKNPFRQLFKRGRIFGLSQRRDNLCIRTIERPAGLLHCDEVAQHVFHCASPLLFFERLSAVFTGPQIESGRIGFLLAHGMPLKHGLFPEPWQVGHGSNSMRTHAADIAASAAAILAGLLDEL